MRASGGDAMASPGNLAGSGMRIVGGLIDAVVIVVIYGIVALIFISAGDARLLPDFVGHRLLTYAAVLAVVIDVAYFAYFWSSAGASIGMMAFGFKVRGAATGQYPTVGKAALRGFIWTSRSASPSSSSGPSAGCGSCGTRRSKRSTTRSREQSSRGADRGG
jgi:hypothetical protein